MNSNLLIDAVVRQTTILIAQLATSAGLRAPLAHLANSVFLELANELESQGISRKVAADMFGLALRSYQAKVQRLTAQKDDAHRSLWEALLEFVRDEEVVSRAEILSEFHEENGRVLKGILRDLVDSGLVFQNGVGDGTMYRFATDEDFEKIASRDASETSVPLVWIHIYLYGPITREELVDRVALSPGRTKSALRTLIDEGRVTVDASGEDVVYTSDVCVIPVGDSAGWEASVFDHFNAVVTALVIKLRNLRLQSRPSDVLGGSTYSFDIWEDHPFADRVLGLLQNTRREMSALREEVDAFNEREGVPDDGVSKVTFYFGQSVVEPADEPLD